MLSSMTSGRRTAVASIAAAVVLLAAFLLARALVPRGPQAPDFTLTDQNGQPFTLSAHRGEGIALFFGYTHCPDVCPTTLAALARAERRVDRAGRAFTVVFVSVDPKRDTPAVLKRYVRIFDPSFVGLTGSERELAPVLAAYHVYRQILPASGASGYLVAHSSTIDFIDGGGHIRTTADWSDTPAELAQAIKETIS